jgi:hypothetical protein
MSPPQVSPYLCWNDGRRFLCIPGGGAVLRLELTEKAALNLLADLATSFRPPWNWPCDPSCDKPSETARKAPPYDPQAADIAVKPVNS